MPYIKKEDRKRFEEKDGHGDETKFWSVSMLGKQLATEGELNYVITRLCHEYIKKHGKSYATLNAVHGVLTCAQLELYRKITAPYEEIKIKENGDV